PFGRFSPRGPFSTRGPTLHDRDMTALVAALGIAQIVSWGTLFYAIGVLGPAMQRDLHVSSLFVFGAFTAGLLVSGAAAPAAGRMVDARGGRSVLSTGSVLGTVAMAILALAPNGAVMSIGWLVAGAAMAACLYDPAFWPLSQLLLDAWGWRATFGIYAMMNALVCLPIHLFLVPPRPIVANAVRGDEERSPAFGDARLPWVNAAFAIASFVFGVFAVHMIALLTAAGLSAREAVGLSMLVGPMQVAGRLVELRFARRTRAVVVGYAAFALLLVAVAAMLGVRGFGAMAVLFVLAYGIGIGLLTIVRGTAPAELFGRAGLGALLGHLSRYASFAKALAPGCYSALVAAGLTRHASLAALGVVALVGTAGYGMAVARRR